MRALALLILGMWAVAARANAMIDCATLIEQSIQSAPSTLRPIAEGDVSGLRSVVRHPASLLWTIEGPVKPEALIEKLHRLMDHIVNLTLSTTPSHVGLLMDFPKYKDYLAIQRVHIDQLVAAWTSDVTGYVDLSDPALLRRPEVMQLASQAYLDERQLVPAIEIENGMRGFRLRYAVPPMNVSGLPLHWSAQLFAAKDGGVRIAVTQQKSFHRLSDHPREAPGQRTLRLYGGLQSLFGQAPHLVPTYHQHIFVRSGATTKPGAKRKTNLERMMGVLKQVARESHGSIDDQEFYRAVVTQFNLQMMHTFCQNSNLCGYLNEQFIQDYVALYGDDALGEWSSRSDSTYEVPDDTFVLDRMFADFCDSEFSVSDGGYRMLGWDRFLKFAQKYFAGYDRSAWEPVLRRFQKSSAAFEGTGMGLTVDMRVPFQLSDQFFASRVELGPVSLKLFFNLSMFENRARVEDLEIKSMVMTFRPTSEAFVRGDLGENHLKTLIHRTEHLLDNP